MSEFMFGKVQVNVKKVTLDDGLVGHIVEIKAPSVPSYALYMTDSQIPLDQVARGAMLHLRDAWLHPQEFVIRRVRQAIEGVESLSEQEEIGVRARQEALDTARFASQIDDFMSEVDDALWRMAKVPKWGESETRSPREWMPGRKRK